MEQLLILPIDLQVYPNVQYRQLVFDELRKHGEISVLSPHLITQTTSTQSHKTIYTREGFRYRTGIYYFQFLLVDGGPTSNNLTFGIGDEHCGTTDCFPGYASMKGVSYHANGYRYWSNTHAVLGATLSKGSRVGILLDTNNRMVSFYHNNIRVGTAAGSDVLTGDIFYPIISTYDLGSTVASLPCGECPSPTPAHAVPVDHDERAKK